MAETLTREKVQWIVVDHMRLRGPIESLCRACGSPWPCATRKLATALLASWEVRDEPKAALPEPTAPTPYQGGSDG